MIHINNLNHGHELMALAGAKFTPETMQVISREEGGKLYGGIIYENYSGPGGSVMIHIASMTPHWINRDLLYVMFDYPFNQLECNQALAHVKASNTACLRFAKSVGWEKVITLDAVYPDDDVVLLRMRRKDCRFLGVNPRVVQSNKGLKDG